MTRPKTIGFGLIGPIVLLLGGLVPSSAHAEEPGATQPGVQTPLVLSDLEGRPRDLGLYRGRIVVLNFWATWCLPCRDEMPLLAEIRERYGGRGVEVIAASTDDEGALQAVHRFVRRQKLNIPVWVGATTLDMRRFGLGDALPATAIIDRDGSIAFRFIGAFEEQDLVERIDYLLGDATGPEPPPLVRTLRDDTSSAPHADHPDNDEQEEGEAGSGHAHDHGGGGDASLVPS